MPYQIVTFILKQMGSIKCAECICFKRNVLRLGIHRYHIKMDFCVVKVCGELRKMNDLVIVMGPGCDHKIQIGRAGTLGDFLGQFFWCQLLFHRTFKRQRIFEKNFHKLLRIDKLLRRQCGKLLRYTNQGYRLRIDKNLESYSKSHAHFIIELLIL